MLELGSKNRSNFNVCGHDPGAWLPKQRPSLVDRMSVSMHSSPDLGMSYNNKDLPGAGPCAPDVTHRIFIWFPEQFHEVAALIPFLYRRESYPLQYSQYQLLPGSPLVLDQYPPLWATWRPISSSALGYNLMWTQFRLVKGLCDVQGLEDFHQAYAWSLFISF